VVGLHWGAYVEHGGRAVIEAAHADLIGLYRDGVIKPGITDRIGLAGLPSALDRLERRQVSGRLVFVP
jgi:NADPH2:quinone reductase